MEQGFLGAGEVLIVFVGAASRIAPSRFAQEGIWESEIREEEVEAAGQPVGTSFQTNR